LSNVYFAIQLSSVACHGSKLMSWKVRLYMDLELIPMNISYF